MPSEAHLHAAGSLSAAVALAGSAGFVDAFIYTQVSPVFVANMSGNLVRVGIAAGDNDSHAVAAAGIALGAFVLGVVVGSLHLERRFRATNLADSGALLIAEGLVVAALGIIVDRIGPQFGTALTGARAAVIVVGAAAMGIQATALRRVGDIAVSTTYGTGALVRLAEKFAFAARRAPRPTESRRRETIFVLIAVLVAYVTGAWIASAFAERALALIAPGIAVIGAGFAMRRGQRPSWAHRASGSLTRK